MKELKRTWIHLALLLVAAVLAYVQSRPKDAADKPLAPGELELWKAKPEDVSRIAFEDDKKRVVLEKQSDKVGLWYLGKVEPLEAAAKPDPEGAAAPKTAVEAATFASASVAKELVKSLSTLRAKRSFGPIGDERMKEFGFDKPEGTLRVTVAGKERALLVGAATAGSSTRYVRDLESRAVYVIDGSSMSDLKAGTARLAERNQHEWKWNEPDSITIAAGGKSKRVVRSGTEGRRFWADANTADQNDETSGNWLSKLERLRPTTFLASLPAGATRVVRVDYRTGSDDKGFFELHYRSGEKESPFVVVTENLRLPAVVTRQSVGQLVDDLATLLPGAELPSIPKEEGPAPMAVPPSDAAPTASAAPAASASAAASAAPAASSDKGKAPPKKPGPSK